MKVKCSNCGKKVPFSGNVCPWCNADKSEQKTIHAISLVCAVIGGIAGGFIFGGFMAAFVGGLIGGVIGAIAATIINARKESHDRNAGNPAKRKR